MSRDAPADAHTNVSGALSVADEHGVERSLAVAVRGAGKRFPNGLAALEPIDLDVERGEFTTLLGPSGCGKSTLLRMIAGLTSPSSGRIEVWPSSNVAAHSSSHPLAFVFQSATLMPWANVERNVRLPLELGGMQESDIRRRVDSALDLVGLRDFATALPRELSGGMQMRVSIARALATEAPLMLMDEPFGALDEITRNRLDREVRELWARKSLTVLFVTHSVYEAVFLSTRVLVMSARPGRIAGEIRIDVRHPRTDSFRTSPQFMQWCAQLSEMLAASSASNSAQVGGAG